MAGRIQNWLLSAASLKETSEISSSQGMLIHARLNPCVKSFLWT